MRPRHRLNVLPVSGSSSARAKFYVRKYLDPAVGSGQQGVQSEVWFVRYRFGEMLLIAAEAAFELNDKKQLRITSIPCGRGRSYHSVDCC